MRYTLRNIPPDLDRVMRMRALEAGQSLNAVIPAALTRDSGLSTGQLPPRSLADLAGAWVEDAEFDKAIGEHHSVDPELWG